MKTTLFFINGPVPSEKELEEKEKMEGRVCFRNSTFIDNLANIESCDFVYGEIPPSYSFVPVYGEILIDEENDEESELKADEEKIVKPNIKPKIQPLKTEAPIWKPNV